MVTTPLNCHCKYLVPWYLVKLLVMALTFDLGYISSAKVIQNPYNENNYFASVAIPCRSNTKSNWLKAHCLEANMFVFLYDWTRTNSCEISVKFIMDSYVILLICSISKVWNSILGQILMKKWLGLSVNYEKLDDCKESRAILNKNHD